MITHETAHAFRKDLVEALKPLEEKYSFKVDVGNIHFTEARLRTTLEAVFLGDGEQAADPLANAQAKSYIKRAGQTPPDKVIGAEVILKDGARGTVMDFSNRRKNHPFEIKIEGKLYLVAFGDIAEFVSDESEPAPPATTVKPPSRTKKHKKRR
jgi:hypothetical protein